MIIPPLKIFKSTLPVSINTIREELDNIMDFFPFERGPFGCSIPLAGRGFLHPQYRDHYNNNPNANIIVEQEGTSQFISFQNIFSLFPSQLTSFRLVRLAPQTSYELHEDRDRGEGVYRFQVPIYSTKQALLCLSDKQNIPESRSEPNIYTPALFTKRFPKNRISSLEEGCLYSFNVDYIHTLYNGSSSHRITLIIDVLLNKALSQWMNHNMIEE